MHAYNNTSIIPMHVRVTSLCVYKYGECINLHSLLPLQPLEL